MKTGLIDIIAGDFKKGVCHEYVYPRKVISLKTKDGFYKEKILISDIQKLEICSDENAINFGKSLGSGLAGSILLGPAGFVVGALLGGKSKNVTFSCVFNDGRKFLGICSEITFNNIKRTLIQMTCYESNISSNKNPIKPNIKNKFIFGIVMIIFVIIANIIIRIPFYQQ